MMKGIAAAAALVLAVGYYFFFYPPVVLKRAAGKALEQFSNAVETKDRSKISAALQTLLSDDAAIHLEVNFVTILQNNNPPVTQDFNKQTFLSFIDNTLYPLTDYAYYPTLKRFRLEGDRHSAQITFISKEWADGANYYGGTAINMRFSSDTVCEGKIIFTGAGPKLNQASCTMQFHSVPKPQDIEKLQNMESMKDYLSKQR